jgi:hypothetical protein
MSLGTVGSQSSENLEPGFGSALASVHRAEVAGASEGDVNSLVTTLNQALILNLQALKLSSANESASKSALLAQVDQILGNVQSRADEIQASASQRTFMQKALTYTFGVIAAVILTVVIAYADRLWRVYKVRRASHMRIILR